MNELAVRSVPVLTNEEVAPGIFHLTVSGCFSAKPAQFFMLRAWGLDPPLARPMSVFDVTDGKDVPRSRSLSWLPGETVLGGGI